MHDDATPGRTTIITFAGSDDERKRLVAMVRMLNAQTAWPDPIMPRLRLAWSRPADDQRGLVP